MNSTCTAPRSSTSGDVQSISAEIFWRPSKNRLIDLASPGSSRSGSLWARGAVVLACVAMLLGCINVEAQTLTPSWSQQSPANSPPARYIHGMTYDSAHKQVVLFGGYGGTGYLNDTWLYNGTTWTQANPVNSPSQRAAVEMAYDAMHGQVVLFGGLTSVSGRAGDTWLWDGTNWTQATPAVSPPARASAAMVYYPGHGVLLFGGVSSAGQEINDTWLWDGTNWTQLTPANSPSARADFGMAYDAALGTVVLFGGDSATGAYLNDTWVWNGTTWIQQNPANSPAVRYAQGMSYDAAAGEVVMFGGYNGQTASGSLNDTWLYDGTNWTQSNTATSPSGRDVPNGMEYDPATNQVVLFGGYASNQYSDTWTFGLPGNFGNVNVCPVGAATPAPCSSTVAFTYHIASTTTFGQTQVVTQGTTGLDFLLGSSTCTGTVAPGSCTVNVTFAPIAPGARLGAVNLVNSNGVNLATTLIWGVGQGPAAVIAPGTPITVASGLNSPYAVTADGAGNVYFTDTGEATVSKVGPNGTTTELGVSFISPTGVAVDGQGNVFVADQSAFAIIEIPAGCISGHSCQNTLAASTGVSAQSAVAVDGKGDVFFASLTPAQVSEIPAGCTSTSCVQVVWTPPAGLGTSQPDGVAVDGAGDVFIADGALDKVLEIPVGCASTSCQVKVGSGFQVPTGVAVDAAGDVFVSDANLGVFEVPAGCATYSCQTMVYAGGAPFGVALDGKGDVVVPLSTGQAVVEVNRSGTQALNFPTTTLGATNTASVTLQNIGNQALQAETPLLINVSGASYAIQAGSGIPVDCSATATLAPGASCNASILFSPQSYTQPNTGTAVFADNALNAASAAQTVTLVGTGAQPVQSFYRVAVTYTGPGSGQVTDTSGAINCTDVSGTSSGTCTVNLPSNGTVTFNAAPSATSTFQGWGGACANAGSNPTCSVVLTQATTIIAIFVNLPTNLLTVTASGTGTGTVTDNLGELACNRSNGLTMGLCSGAYAPGTLVTLTESASGSSVFVGWGGACANSYTIPSCIVTVDAAQNVSASFVAASATQSGTLMPITAGVVYGQGGSFASNLANNGGVTAGSLGNSQGMLVDSSGNLYVADGANNRVLFYPAGSTTPTRVYGQNGSFTSNNAGTSASSLHNPQGIAVDGSGNVYVSDEVNSRVLFYPAGSTIATRVYGQGGSFTSATGNNGGVSADSLYIPMGIVLDQSGNLYVADYGNSRILFYPSGSTTATRVYGQGGSFTSNTPNNGGISTNSLNQAQAVAMDNSGDLYAADSHNNRVLFYPANSTTATQVYGQGGSFTSGIANNGGVDAGTLNNPLALALDSNNGLYVVDRSNNRVLYYPFGTAGASRVYGQGGSFNSATLNNGGISANSLSQPWGVAVGGNGELYIADYGNSRVLGFGSFGNVSVCPANQGGSSPCNNTVTYSYAAVSTTVIGATQVLTQGAPGLDFSLGTNTCKGTITEGSTCDVDVNFTPLAPGLRTGAVQLYDNAANLVASAPAYGVGQEPQIAFGPGVQIALPLTGLHYNVGVAVDASGNTFVADYTAGVVVKYSPTGAQTTVPATGLSAPIGVAVDGAGAVYIVDQNLPYAVKVTPGGVQSTLGSGLSNPIGIALDGAGDVFIGDRNNNRVVEISPTGVQTTVPATGLNQPWGVAVDAQGDVFIADGGNSRVLEVTPAGVQTIVAANGVAQPYGVAVDAAGDVYIADPVHARVVEVPAGGGAQITVGSGLNYPSGVTVDGAGNLLIGDQGAGQVVKLNRSQPPAISFATTNVGSTSTDSPVSFTVQNIGNQVLTGSLVLNLGGSFAETNTQDCSASLPLGPGGLCVESFSFTPQSSSFFSGTAMFTDNSLNLYPLATQTVNLVGTGAVNGVAATVAVPNLLGQTQAAAAAPLSSVGLAMGSISTASSPTVPLGSIISENPVAGTQVAVGSVVNLLVSSGITQAPSPNPLVLENNYFVTGDYVSAGVTLRATGVGGMATGSITIPSYTQSATQGVPDGADVVDAFLYWETLENTATASSTLGTFNGFPIVGQQIGNDLQNYTDGVFTGTLRAYRAAVNAYLPVGAAGTRIVSGTYKVSLPDARTAVPVTEGASLVMVYRVLSPNFPLKSVVIYDGAAIPAVAGTQVVQGFYDATGGANSSGKNTNVFASNGSWNNSVNTVALGSSNRFNAVLNPANAYAAVILSTPVNNSDNDGILDAWKAGPGGSDFHAGQPGYYDVKTSTWVGLAGAKHGQKDLFVQLDYMCGALLASGACDPGKENLFPSPDTDGNDPLAMVQQAFANSGVQLHLQVGNAVPEDTCVDGSSSQLCQFPGQPGVIGWKNSLEFSKLYPRNLYACLTGGDCTTRFPYGQKDSYHYVLMGHSLAIPAWNTRYGTLTSIKVVSGVTTITTVDRGTGINACPSRITLGGVLGNPALNGVYNTTGCADTKTISLLTPGVPNYTYPNSILPEPVIGLTSGTITSISGYSDLGGADSAVTLGLWLTAPNQDMSKKANVLAGTIFHEIGHTLGLSHGGLYFDTPNSYVPTFDANCKPNYQSVMNYLFQLDLVGPNQTLAFSNQTLNTINENAAGSMTQLTDGSGNPATFPTSSWYVPYTLGSPVSPATRHCDGTPLTGDSSYRVDASIAPITPAWSSPQDLSFVGTLQSAERGFNDLTNMDLRQVGATGGEFASLATALSFGSSVAPLNISAGGNVTLGSGGTIALGSGGNITLGSGGNVTLGSGGTIALGSGGNITLGSGGNATVPSGSVITPGGSGTIALGSGGNVTLGSGGTITLGSGGNITLGSGGNVTLGSGGNIALGSGGNITVPSTGGTYSIDGSGGVITLGSGGNITLGSGGNVTLGSGGNIALGSGGNIILGSGGNITLGSGGNIALGSGGNVILGSGGNITLGSGGTITLGSGGNITLGSGGNVILGSGGTVTLGSGGNLAAGDAGNITLGSGGAASIGAGGTITLGSGGSVAIDGAAGNITLGSGGNITLGSGGSLTLNSGGNITLGSGGNITLGSGGVVTPFGGSAITVAAGGNITLGSGGNIALGSGGNITLGSGGNIALGSGGNIALGSGGNIALGSGGTIALGSGGNITLGSGGVITLGANGSLIQGTGSSISLGSVNNITPASGGPLAANELTYETANSVVRPPTAPTETPSAAGVSPASVRINWKAPVFGVVQTYTIYRSSNGATPVVIGSVSGVNGNPPATEFTDSNPDTISATVVYTVTTLLVPDTSGPSRQSVPSPPAVIKNDQSIVLGPLPSSVTLANPPTITATAMSGGAPNGLQVAFSAAGSCLIAGQSIMGNISSAVVALVTTGSCTVTATQPGTTAFNAANSVSGTFMVLPLNSGLKSQTITFPLLPNTQYGQSFTLGATSSVPNTAVSYMASGPCTASGGISGIGVCKITASAPATSTYSGASLTQSFNIYPAVLKVTADSLNVTFGQPVPALTYLYSGFVNGDTASVVSGKPALSTIATAASSAGSYPIVVATGSLATTNYSFLYVDGTLTVQAANQTALVLTTSSPLTFNQSETMSVAGGSTGGSVTYNLISGTCTIAGAKLTAGSGTGSCIVTATMAGSTNYSSITSTPAVVSLGLAVQTIAFTTNPPSTAPYNGSFTVAATSTSGGAVAFTSSGACSNIGAVYTMTSGTGICSVIANQSATSNYLAAAPITKTVSAALVAPRVTFTGAPVSAAYQANFTVATTTTASSAAVITSSGACKNVLNAVTMSSGTGTCLLTATWASDTNYSGASSSQSTAATLASQTITFATNPPISAAYNSSFTVAAIGGASANAVSYTSAGSCSNMGATYKMTSGAGTCSVIVNEAGNANYAVANTVTKSVSATLASQAITFMTNPPLKATYGSSFTVAATGGASANGLTYTSAGSCINAGATYKITSGSGSCSVIANQAGDTNFSAAMQITKLVTAALATPAITWPAPAAIGYGTALSAAQLDATASVPGTFVYTPKSGTVPSAGMQTLAVVFTPTDTTDYSTATAAVSLTVNAPSVSIGISNTTQTYQQWTNFVIGPIYTGSRVPTGSVTLYDNGAAITTLTLGGDGKAYYTAGPFNVGPNVLTATYTGNSYFPAGTSAPVTITVLPAPTNFQASCYGAQTYGTVYQCSVSISASTSMQPGGTITYSFDGGAPVSVAIVHGNAPFTVAGVPNAGSHTLVLNYAAQGNFAAAAPISRPFITQRGQTQVQASPSSYYLASGSAITISGTVTTPGSGIPTGTVTFYDGNNLIGTGPIGAKGTISYRVASIAKGPHIYKVSYAGSPNYSPATSSTCSVTAF